MFMSMSPLHVSGIHVEKFVLVLRLVGSQWPFSYLWQGSSHNIMPCTTLPACISCRGSQPSLSWFLSLPLNQSNPSCNLNTEKITSSKARGSNYCIFASQECYACSCCLSSASNPCFWSPFLMLPSTPSHTMPPVSYENMFLGGIWSFGSVCITMEFLIFFLRKPVSFLIGPFILLDTRVVALLSLPSMLTPPNLCFWTKICRIVGKFLTDMALVLIFIFP